MADQRTMRPRTRERSLHALCKMHRKGSESQDLRLKQEQCGACIRAWHSTQPACCGLNRVRALFPTRINSSTPNSFQDFSFELIHRFAVKTASRQRRNFSPKSAVRPHVQNVPHFTPAQLPHEHRRLPNMLCMLRPVLLAQQQTDECLLRDHGFPKPALLKQRHE